MSKIIYLIEQPLDARNYDRFGISIWIARGWAVEVWDLTPVAHPLAWEDFRASGRELSRFDRYFPIESRRELRDKCSAPEGIDYFIDLTGDGRCSVRVKLSLVRSGARRVVLTGSIPAPDEDGKSGLVRRLCEELSKGPLATARRLGDAVSRKLAQPRIRPEVFIVAGEKSIPPTGPAQQIVRAHNFDYDSYLKLRETVNETVNEYGVFLDQNLCYAPDYVYENVPAYATPESYFPAICRGLRQMSGVLRVPVRIAAHPRLSRQKKYADYFEGLPVEYGKTAELICGSKFVVCHYTTAIQFAVLFAKPVLFVTTDELAASPARKYIARFAAELGRPVINLDTDLERVDWRAELRIDSRKYDEYRKAYIKADGSPQVSFWDIVVDHVESARRQRG